MTETGEISVDHDKDAALPPSAKLMLRVVYIMGIVLVLLFLVLVGAIVWKANHKTEPRPDAPSPIVNLNLPQGTKFQSAVLDGDRLAVNTGDEIIVIDLRKNSVISRITANPQ